METPTTAPSSLFQVSATFYHFSFSFFCDFGAGEYFKSNFSLYMKEWNCFCKVGSSCGKQQRPPKQKSKLITFVLSVIYQMLSPWQAFTDNFQRIFVSTFCWILPRDIFGQTLDHSYFHFQQTFNNVVSAANSLGASTTYRLTLRFV